MSRTPKRDDPRNVILVGATSGIARPLGRRLVARGWNLVVTGRDAARLAPLADDLRVRGSGTVATLVFDPSDGAAKAGLTAYLSGLRNRLHPRGVAVLTVKPGIVRTPMTEGLAAARSPLAADADTVARDIERAILRRQDVLYTPWFWWPVMTVIGAIPEAIFKRLKL